MIIQYQGEQSHIHLFIENSENKKKIIANILFSKEDIKNLKFQLIETSASILNLLIIPNIIDSITDKLLII